MLPLNFMMVIILFLIGLAVLLGIALFGSDQFDTIAKGITSIEIFQNP